MTSLTKNEKPKSKNIFFIADLMTCQVFWKFEQLSSTFGAIDIPV